MAPQNWQFTPFFRGAKWSREANVVREQTEKQGRTNVLSLETRIVGFNLGNRVLSMLTPWQDIPS